MIYKLVQDSSFWIEEIDREHRKNPHRTTSIRQAIVPADAISLRCNHSTRHVTQLPHDCVLHYKQDTAW